MHECSTLGNNELLDVGDEIHSFPVRDDNECVITKVADGVPVDITVISDGSLGSFEGNEDDDS